MSTLLDDFLDLVVVVHQLPNNRYITNTQFLYYMILLQHKSLKASVRILLKEYKNPVSVGIKYYYYNHHPNFSVVV